MAASTKDLVKRFAKLDLQIKKKEDEANALRAERDALEAQLLQRFQEGGMASMKLTGGVIVYLRRDLYAGAKDKDSHLLIDAIKQIPDIAAMVQEKVNAQTLAAYVRERGRDYFGDAFDSTPPEKLLDALPAPLQPVIAITERFSLRTKKG